MSSSSIALLARPRTDSEQRARVDGGVVGSSINFSRESWRLPRTPLQLRDGLAESGPAGGSICSLELRVLHPAQERFRGDANCTGGVFQISVDEERRNRVLLCSTEFCAMADHLRDGKLSLLRLGILRSLAGCAPSPD
jgi:hypothetical protein